MTVEAVGTTSRPASTDDWDHHWSQYGESAEDNPAQSYRRRLVLALLGLLLRGLFCITALVQIAANMFVPSCFR